MLVNLSSSSSATQRLHIDEVVQLKSHIILIYIFYARPSESSAGLIIALRTRLTENRFSWYYFKFAYTTPTVIESKHG